MVRRRPEAELPPWAKVVSCEERSERCEEETFFVRRRRKPFPLEVRQRLCKTVLLRSATFGGAKEFRKAFSRWQTLQKVCDRRLEAETRVFAARARARACRAATTARCLTLDVVDCAAEARPLGIDGGNLFDAVAEAWLANGTTVRAPAAIAKDLNKRHDQRQCPRLLLGGKDNNKTHNKRSPPPDREQQQKHGQTTTKRILLPQLSDLTTTTDDHKKPKDTEKTSPVITPRREKRSPVDEEGDEATFASDANSTCGLSGKAIIRAYQDSLTTKTTPSSQPPYLPASPWNKPKPTKRKKLTTRSHLHRPVLISTAFCDHICRCDNK